MDESIKPSKYVVRGRIGLAVLAGLVVIVLLWMWVDDAPNADPRQGRVYIHKSGAWDDEDYEHYMVCVGPHLYEVYDMYYESVGDKEVKTSYADACES